MLDALPINFNLIKNPINWLIVVLMLVIAGYALHILLPNLFPENPVTPVT